MFDDIAIEMHRTIRELTARAEAKVRSGQLGLAFEGLDQEVDHRRAEQAERAERLAA